MIKLGGLIPIKIIIETPTSPNWEPQQVFTYPPWWPPPYTAIDTREEAINTHKTLAVALTTLSLYTDNNKLDSEVGET
jgi:hypothetical protein